MGRREALREGDGVETFIIRPAMADGAQHRLQSAIRGQRSARRCKAADESTHEMKVTKCLVVAQAIFSSGALVLASTRDRQAMKKRSKRGPMRTSTPKTKLNSMAVCAMG